MSRLTRIQARQPFTEREIKQLHKLLIKFHEAQTKEGTAVHNMEARTILAAVTTWVRWHAQDDLDVDL